MLRKRDGFTLVECLIGIFILSFALLTMAAFAGSLMKANLQAKQIQTASTLMEAKTEELKNIPSILLTNGTTQSRKVVPLIPEPGQLPLRVET